MKQKSISFSCRKRDIRHIRITCRCGKISVAEIPQQLARAMNFFPCPQCQAGFMIQQDEAGKWKIERVVESIADMAVIHGTEEEPQPSSSYTGLRIKIVDGSKSVVGAQNPHPEHIGKSGTIIGEKDCGGGHMTPVIKLDDGTKLLGAECWWEPIKN